MYFLYTMLLTIALILGLPYWLVQMARHGKYRAGLAQRFGRVPQQLRATLPEENCIWVHAVSVGEVFAVTGLIGRLRQRFPQWRIVVSTTTQTGQRLARERFRDDAFFFPLDLPFALTPYLRHLRPKLVVVAETEFWPNFLRAAKDAGARVSVVNARISDRSFPRYRSFRSLLRRVLAQVDLFLAQSKLDRDRLVAIGADPQRVQVGGNLKFDVAAPKRPPIIEQLRSALPHGAPFIVCGSTVEGEESLLLDAFRDVLRDHRDAVLLLAPRHPERFDAVAGLTAQQHFSFWRRSAWTGARIGGGVFLLDTIGELASLYELATIAFVGGSLVPRGGHNILEPAQFGRATVVGPHTENFRDVINIFRGADAVRVSTATKISSDWRTLLNAPHDREVLGRAALRTFQAHAGAAERTLDALEVLLWMPSSIEQRYRPVRP